MTAIKINLDDLTQAHIDEAAPFLRHCSYSAPCIIGALMPEHLRAAADDPLEDSDGSASIEALVKCGRIELADPSQIHALGDIQDAFDAGDVLKLEALLDARGLQWTGMSEEEARELALT